MTDAGPLLLFDGVCPLCNGVVLFVLKRDRTHSVRFAPLQGTTAAGVLSSRPELAAVDSVVWVDATGTALIRSDAVLAIGRYLGGGWAALSTLARVVPRPVRDRIYDLVARTRYRVFGRYDACPLPPSEHRARFLP